MGVAEIAAWLGFSENVPAATSNSESAFALQTPLDDLLPHTVRMERCVLSLELLPLLPRRGLPLMLPIKALHDAHLLLLP